MVGYVLPFCQKLDWWNRYHPIHHLKILKSTWKDSSLCFNSCWVVPLLGPCWHDDDAMRTGTRTNGIRPQEVSQLRRCGLELGNSSCVRNNLGPLKLQLCQSMTVWPMWYYSPKDSAYMCIYVHIYIPALMSLLLTSHILWSHSDHCTNRSSHLRWNPQVPHLPTTRPANIHRKILPWTELLHQITTN